MSVFSSVSEIQAQIEAYKAALMAISVNKEYTINGMTYTRAELPEIRKTLEWLDSEKKALLSSTGTKLQINRAYVGRG